MKKQRFILAKCNSNRWFIIPQEKAKDWNAFVTMDENDPASWNYPKWAIRVGGSYNLVSFTDFEIE